MKTIFSTKRNALLTSGRVSWGAYALLVAVLVALVRLVAPATFITWVTPVTHGSRALTSWGEGVVSSFEDRARLERDVRELEQENAVLVLQVNELESRVSTLTNLQGIVRGSVPLHKATVLLRPPESPYDVLVLDQGSNAGITVGMMASTLVTASSSARVVVPIGTVASVTSTAARVVLFTSPRVKTSVWVGNTHVPLTLVGSGESWWASAPRSASIVVGDSVRAPGEGAPLGVVARIDSDPSSPSMGVWVTPLVNSLSIVDVYLQDAGSLFRDSVSCVAGGTL